MEPTKKSTERQCQSATTVKNIQKEYTMKINQFISESEPSKRSMSSNCLQINPSPLMLTQLKREPKEIYGIWGNYMDEVYKGNFPEQENQTKSPYISLDGLFDPPVEKTVKKKTKEECALFLFGGFLNQKEETNTDVALNTSKKIAFAKTTSDSLDAKKTIPQVESNQPNVIKTFTSFLEFSSSDSSESHQSSRSESDRKKERKKIKKYDFTSI